MVVFWAVMRVAGDKVMEKHDATILCPQDGSSTFGTHLQVNTASHNPEDHHGHLHRRESLKSSVLCIHGFYLCWIHIKISVLSPPSDPHLLKL
jgi:hypothetical protein